MTNLIFSLNATMPVFILILIGWFLGEIGMLTKDFTKVSNKFAFHIALPALLIVDISAMDIQQVFDMRFVIFCMVSTTVSFFSIWGLAKMFLKEKDSIGAFVQGAFRGSAAILGVAFVQNMYGNSGMVPLMIIGAVPLFNIYSVLVLTFEGENAKKDGSGMRRALINILHNPIIIGILIGMIASILHIYEHLPVIISKPLSNLASLASPLALLTIGAEFEGKKALKKMKPTLWATFYKLIGMPLIFLPIAIALGFREDNLIAILIMLGAPTTVSSYIMAVNMEHDGVLASSIVVLTTLLSAITLTAEIYILKILGLV